jgi:gas vesicle protein
MREQRNGGGLMMAAFMGAIAGATAMILLDEDRREKVRRQINRATESGENEVARLRKEAKILKEKLAKQVAEQLAQTSKKLSK